MLVKDKTFIMNSLIIERKTWAVRLVGFLIPLYILYFIFTFWSCDILRLHDEDESKKITGGNVEFYGGMLIFGLVIRILSIPVILRQGYMLHHDKDDALTQERRLNWTLWLELYLYINLITMTIINGYISVGYDRNNGNIPGLYKAAPIVETVILFSPVPFIIIWFVALLCRTNCKPCEII